MDFMIKHLCPLFILAAGLWLAPLGKSLALERLHLKSGETREGISVDVAENAVKWVGTDGKLSLIPLDDIAKIEYLDADEAKTDEPAVTPASSEEPAAPSYVLSEPADVIDPTAPPATEPEALVDAEGNPLPPDAGIAHDSYWNHFCDWTCNSFERWTHRLELGARVLRGNSIEEYVNLGGKFEDQTDERLSQIDFSGQYGRNRGIIASNRWIINSNTDFNREGNWIVFITTKNEYDEFENLDYRGTLSSGLGYKFIDEPNRRIITRVGPGVTYEKFNKPSNERVTPDLFTELETLWPIGASASYEHRTTTHPSVTDFSLIRIVSSHGLLFRLDDDGKWQFMADFRYEYNSQPNPGRLRSDYTTNLSIVYTRK